MTNRLKHTTNQPMNARQAKRLIAALSSLVLFFLAGNAAAKKSATEQVAPQGSGNVKAIEAAYHSLSDLTARFVQTTKVALIDRTVTRKGTFRFKKGGKLRIEYEGADKKTYVSDGATLWIFVPGDEASTQTFAVNDETVPKEALSFLGGFGKLTKEFSISTSSAFSDAAPDTTALHLVPKGKAKHYDSLDGLFGADHLLLELVITNTSGNVSRYKFSDIKTNTGLSDGLFTLSSGKTTPGTLPE
ncbi:MAG: outer membrane lipoprotein carrier protein LolA [Pseudomonadota bacterium]